MKHRCLLIAVCAAILAAGCASLAPRRAELTGERTARVADVTLTARSDGSIGFVPVAHVFGLSNPGAEPVIVTSSRTRIDTVWHFTDTGDAVLPRTINPGDTLRVAVTAKVRRPGEQRYFVELQLATGDAVRLELLVESRRQDG